MTELEHKVRGGDHAAFPTFDPAATVRFYRRRSCRPLTTDRSRQRWCCGFSGRLLSLIFNPEGKLGTPVIMGMAHG